jgi:pentatricopeptide repeat protein
MRMHAGSAAVPDNYTFSTVITALGRLQDASGAQNVFAQMKVRQQQLVGLLSFRS